MAGTAAPRRPWDPRLARRQVAVRRALIANVCTATISCLAVLAQAALVAHTITAATTTNQPLPAYLLPLAGIAGLVVVRSVAIGALERIGQRRAFETIAGLRNDLLQQLVRRPSHQPAAATTSLLTTGVSALEPYLTRYLPQLVQTAVVTPLVTGVIMWLDPIAGLTIVATLPLIPFFMALVGWSTEASARRQLASMTRLGTQVLDVIAGLGTLRLLGRHRAQTARIRQLGDRYRTATMASLRQTFLSALVLESLTTLAVALVAVGIGLRLVHGNLDLQTGLTVLLLAPEAYLPLRMLGVHFHASANGVAAIDQTMQLLTAEDDQPRVDQTPTAALPVPDMTRTTIVFDAVSVQHETAAAQPLIAQSIVAPAACSGRIAPAAITAIVGTNGTGKSTLVQVLLGLRPPTSGSVWLHSATPSGKDDLTQVELTNVDLNQWHQQIAWVPQHPTIEVGTVLSNLWLSDTQAASDPPQDPSPAVLATADRCGLTPVIRDLPQGWHTQVGHGGYGLSAGQRQRLALTRAFLRDAPLVIVDEPTAHLDTATQHIIHQALRDLRHHGRTVVVVAHRPELITLADHIIEVQAHENMPEAATT